MTREKWRLN